VRSLMEHTRYRPSRSLRSSPTLRSSDLPTLLVSGTRPKGDAMTSQLSTAQKRACAATISAALLLSLAACSTETTGGEPPDSSDRSEEHTSELQSRENLVCRLLLEKKTLE